MENFAVDLAQRLAARAEAVCHHYLPNGVRRGGYLVVGDVAGTKGRSLYVRLRSSSNAGAGKWTDAATGEHGDLLDLIRLNRGLATVSEAFDEARAFLNEPPRQAVELAAYDTAEGAARNPAKAAARLFVLTSPVPGTIAEIYLGAAASPPISTIQPSASWPTAITAPRAATSQGLCLRLLPA